MNNFKYLLFILLFCAYASAQDQGSSDSFRFGVGVGYTGQPIMIFKSAQISGASGNSRIEALYKPAPILELDIRYLRKNNWGPMANLIVDFEHAFNSVTYNGVNNVTSVFNDSKFSLITLSAGLTYRWDNFYLPFGLNYTLINFSPSASFAGSVSMKGGNYGQFGIGYYFTENIIFDILIFKNEKVKFSTTTNSGVNDDYGLGDILQLSGCLKYFF